MDLILWRHAEAEDGIEDLDRALTRHGQRQASRMASWLRDRLPDDYVLLASEAKRSKQTAEYLSKSYVVLPELNPGAGAEDVLSAVNWPEGGGTVVVVGHQPYIGWLTAQLLAEQQQMWSVKKGSVWWLNRRERHGIEQVRLKVMLTPGMLDP
ncbi:SixA phosphatase family protein [Chromobacterium alticapitis]|uniref:Histidine phosphatase family protein n=1 Tax=Chromobacterium alticapitis TaxID=2073169 RepID=A0A2S5DF99_9NEIS|nr:histidine phosphatase family protein [Chromobacterium alticapitis]POZ61724.1 histidine phosphatase family protein [Chromobacterium alticapitis]